MLDKNALAELAKELADFQRYLHEEFKVGDRGLEKAQSIIVELAKVKLVNGTYGAVAVLSETETDSLFHRILAIAEKGECNG